MVSFVQMEIHGLYFCLCRGILGRVFALFFAARKCVFPSFRETLCRAIVPLGQISIEEGSTAAEWPRCDHTLPAVSHPSFFRNSSRSAPRSQTSPAGEDLLWFSGSSALGACFWRSLFRWALVRERRLVTGYRRRGPDRVMVLVIP